MTMMTGTVAAVSSKDVTTKFGVKPTFSFSCNGKWIKCGFKNPFVEPGFIVDFDGVEGTYGIETKAVNIISRSSVAPAGGLISAVSAPAMLAPVKAPYSSGYKEKAFPIPALHGDRAIVRQNGLARATELYVAARGGKPFELDKDSITIIIQIARGFEAYSAGDLDLAEAQAEEAADTIDL